jgi:hypothetical protein
MSPLGRQHRKATTYHWNCALAMRGLGNSREGLKFAAAAPSKSRRPPKSRRIPAFCRSEADGPTTQNEALADRQTLPASTECEAGSMSALSLTPNVRGRRFQMHHYRGCARDPLMSWRCEPLSLLIFLCGPAKKVSAAPHRGNANGPIRNQGEAKKSDQGKANPVRAQPKSAAKANNSRKGQRHKSTDKTSAAQAKNQAGPNAVGNQVKYQTPAPPRISLPLGTRP